MFNRVWRREGIMPEVTGNIEGESGSDSDQPEYGLGFKLMALVVDGTRISSAQAPSTSPVIESDVGLSISQTLTFLPAAQLTVDSEVSGAWSLRHEVKILLLRATRTDVAKTSRSVRDFCSDDVRAAEGIRLCDVSLAGTGYAVSKFVTAMSHWSFIAPQRPAIHRYIPTRIKLTVQVIALSRCGIHSFNYFTDNMVLPSLTHDIEIAVIVALQSLTFSGTSQLYSIDTREHWLKSQNIFVQRIQNYQSLHTVWPPDISRIFLAGDSETFTARGPHKYGARQLRTKCLLHLPCSLSIGHSAYAEADFANLQFLAFPTIKAFDGDKYRAQHQLGSMTFLILHGEIHLLIV
ncbi:hypothetical protein C8R48DRAFT_670330 [Suillus tomentosus]|nr:hypothetical protein C8R48DRAFT_670330 [Suillus tomentosus]